jgi:hypothetical protein
MDWSKTYYNYEKGKIFKEILTELRMIRKILEKRLE